MPVYVAKPPDFYELMLKIGGDRLVEILRVGAHEDRQEYVHWDKLRHLQPPEGLSREDWWFLIKSGRQRSQRTLPLADPAGEPFVYNLPDSVARRLHYIDQHCSGEVAMPEVVTADAHAQQHYLVNSLMEEAIRSSQLEGASTTRKMAKELLQTGREPADRSERMILNNYRALRYMRDAAQHALTPELVLELQRILTEGTLDDPSAAGRLQRPDEVRVVVTDRLDGSVVHTPPPAEQLRARLDALCAFANAPGDRGQFIHPVVRAILLHFWLAYDHPFEDGNGRTARALFYWYMRNHGYWLVEYLSISRILRHAPSRYSRAFLLTETDERDATYFLDYQLEVIERAIGELHAYLERQIEDVREVERLLKSSSEFNHRQLSLLGDALRTPDSIYFFSTHAASHGVTHETARADLLALARRGLLIQQRHGRRYSFVPPADLASRLKTAH
jgi:Fic family protein